jgi:hypothetical protein
VSPKNVDPLTVKFPVRVVLTFVKLWIYAVPLTCKSFQAFAPDPKSN